MHDEPCMGGPGLQRSMMLFLIGLAASAAPVLAADDNSEITAVFASAQNDYRRVKRPDGSFQTETYAFGEGGFTGIPLGDESVGTNSFMQIARVVAPALARNGYESSRDPEKTDLLIMVYWGTTGADSRNSGGYTIGPAAIPPPPPPPPVVVAGNGQVIVVSTPPPPVQAASSPEQSAFDAMAGAQNRQRDRENARNAQMLGYDDELYRASARPESRRYLDLVDEVEDMRYFVVLRAYDFQLLWKRKERKALWEVRYSIRARNHLFGDALVAMTGMAARYFGQDSKGLIRGNVPVGRVSFGDTIFSDYSEPNKK